MNDNSERARIKSGVKEFSMTGDLILLRLYQAAPFLGGLYRIQSFWKRA
jgi:hypothetical protein